MNLKDLLSNYKIEIPMLQRDYAQGRKSQKRVAGAFLDSIFKVLRGEQGKESLHIDFIYGYEEGDGENKKFILIDGQQRITTLWLLHFYLYKKAGFLGEMEGWLSRFSYNTRASSAKFCKNLLKKDFDLSKEPSKAIKAQGGEFEKATNLNNDPTIKAMLNMLDLIYERICDGEKIEGLVESLSKITFDLFDMEKFSLGEELYVKMNARGKQLSKYENLKSFIEKDPEISQDMKLLEKIDTCWSDYFFDSCKPSAFDVRGNNFLHYATIFFNLNALEGNEKPDPETIEKRVKDPNQAIDEFYKPLQKIDNIRLLDRVMDLLIKLKSDLELEIPLKTPKFFDNFKEDRLYLSNQNVCYFFSVLCFVRANGGDEVENQALEDYLRVSRHFIENHRRDAEDIYNFLKLFQYLSRGCKDIYQFLKEKSYSYDEKFHKNFYQLEARKARLISVRRDGGEDWETILNKTSDHKELKGWVDFLLDFSDEEFVYESKKEFGKPNLEKFKKYANLTMQILDKCFSKKDNLVRFQRALLCQGDFGIPVGSKFFYGKVWSNDDTERLHLNRLFGGKESRGKSCFFKSFLDDLVSMEGKDLLEKMDEMIKKTRSNFAEKEWWMQLLIGQEDLFKFLKGGRIEHKGSEKVELIKNEARTSVGMRDLLDYGFYCYCKKREKNLTKYNANQNNEKQSRFSLNDQKVVCKSKESLIEVGDQKYPIDLQKDIFAEFARVLEEIDKNGD